MPWAWVVRNWLQVGPAATRGGVDPGVVQDSPYGRGRDLVAEPGQFALHAPVAPQRVLGGHADHQSSDRLAGWPASGAPHCGGVFLGGELAVPGQQGARGHREDLGPPAPRDQRGKRREPEPVLRPVTDLLHVPTQHRVLMAQHQQFGLAGHIAPREGGHGAEDLAGQPVGEGDQHSAMLPAQRQDLRPTTRFVKTSPTGANTPGAAAGAEEMKDRCGNGTPGL